MEENDQDQQYQPEDDQSDEDALSPEPATYKEALSSESATDENGETGEVVPGVSVVRENTPRPHPFEAFLAASGQLSQEQATARSAFPGRPPSAPPLPEELEDDEQEQTASTTDVSVLSEETISPQEFVWLFEYGLEMESVFLNSPDRLNGAAFLYGPAVLRGYTLMFAQETQTGQFLSTIVPSAQQGAEVWGVLYRVPRRVTTRNDRQPSLLDSVHAAGTSVSLFAPVSVTVRETYHEREISCGTYALTPTARQQLRLLTPAEADSMTRLVRRIASLAKKQKLPSHYLKISFQPPPAAIAPETAQSRKNAVAMPLAREQNTDPLPIVKGKNALPDMAKVVQGPVISPFSRLLVALAIYLVLVLLLVLACAALQGIGFASRFLTTNLQLLGVPWLVLVYGVLGGNVSSIVALGRARRLNLPPFTIILWFVRPFVGGVLALFAYLLLNSGLFTIVDLATTHTTLFPLMGALAGLCEGRLFVRWR